ncbi:antibiotic biosynthesis monooxygenase family protein [Noviherbaspirillum pedocola]|uniref:Antibiotic biosynthesis monooxygenase n=1 Tax=Noviherbaspirillum pedocola TaxID=2801341 RepID=A0A934W5H2_9BURK|nr:antibiotic biosynthesis monooxygenase family protein [Noviherbaspirillum pedocola]MBK4734952.1 antibiotic biosynthesis monooxygenase [Noviherbaspirillum pedocola]
MIFELAEIRVKAGSEQQFLVAVAEAAPLFQRARGCRSMRVQRSIEQPDMFTLVVGWDSVEDHMVHFRNSDDFQEWRRLAGPHFAEPPKVQHVSTVYEGF